MPVNDISAVQKLLFGVCCLDGEEAQQVHTLWHQRFAEHSAFLVDAKPGDSIKAIVEKLEQEIRKQSIQNLFGRSVILTLYLDLTEKMDPEWQNSLWSLQTVLDNYFGSATQLVFQFGFVGKLNLESATVQRENASVIVNELNGTKPAAVRYTLCLVAKPALAGSTGTNWKAAMLFLDLLRRQTIPSSILPATDDGILNNDIAFLRYEEYDEKQHEKLTARHKTLDLLLHNHGQQEFAQLVERELQTLREQLAQRFIVNGGAQPQHTGMILDGAKSGVFSNPVAQAKKGKSPVYNQGKNETYSAVQATARRLREDIQEFCRPIIEKAPKRLREMMDEVNLGIALKKDRDEMHSLLNTGTNDTVRMPELLLNYSESGAAQEIGEYLEAVRLRQTAEGWKQYRQALIEAYDTITDAEFANEEAELQLEFEDVIRKLAQSQKPKDFCEQIVTYRDPAICDFKIGFGTGKNEKYVLARTNTLVATLNQAAFAGAAVRCFEIKETGGGIVQLDDAPLKALQAVYLDYSEAVMKKLLPDVEV